MNLGRGLKATHRRVVIGSVESGTGRRGPCPGWIACDPRRLPFFHCCRFRTHHSVFRSPGHSGSLHVPLRPRARNQQIFQRDSRHATAHVLTPPSTTGCPPLLFPLSRAGITLVSCNVLDHDEFQLSLAPIRIIFSLLHHALVQNHRTSFSTVSTPFHKTVSSHLCTPAFPTSLHLTPLPSLRASHTTSCAVFDKLPPIPGPQTPTGAPAQLFTSFTVEPASVGPDQSVQRVRWKGLHVHMLAELYLRVSFSLASLRIVVQL